jgi:hypothetical protein
MITVEYLLPFNTEDGICANIDSFKALLSTNSNFKIKTNKIEYKRSAYDFSVSLNVVENQNCSVFNVTFGITRVTDKFREMLKAFRKTIGLHLKDNIQIIWDGVSFEWSKSLYPEIYQTENSLRKLISKFMLTKLGIGWHKASIPKDVAESIKKENYKPTHSILYEVDFIQLANFLFKPYSVKDTSKLPDILSGLIESEMTQEKKNEILEYIPKNNWDRYFSDLVEFESVQLKKKWENLYEIRCKVAHNKSMIYEEYETAMKLCVELNHALNKAYENLESIEIPEEDKESIGLRTIGVVNEPTSYFVNRYLNLSDRVSDIFKVEPEKYSFLSNVENPLSAIIDYSSSGLLNVDPKIRDDLFSINNYKNELLSGSSYINAFDNRFDNNLIIQKETDFLSALKSDTIFNPTINADNYLLNRNILDASQESKRVKNNNSEETDENE